ncbi:DNA-binding SARP family transcriptional activator [Bradyrhizobium diazoefficiens]
MTAFSLGTFGFPEVHADDRLIKLALRKGLALLVYVAEAKGAVARDVVATLLWPESPGETGRARLRRLLHRIEQTLGQPVFETDRASVRWSPAIALKVDTHLFESACDRGDFEQACRIYRSDFLAGFALDDCPEFDDWAFFRREALRGRLMNALERLVQDKNAAGEHFAATVHAGRLVELDPLSEVYGRHLIRSLLLAGDRSAAERHHAALTQRMRDELGVAPEAETEALMSPAAAALAVPTTRYVKGAGVHLAYQTYGSGPLDILVMPGFVSHVERAWEHPASRTFLASLMKLGRLIVFDRRGIGLSDRVGSAPGIDVTAEDIGTVLRATNARRVVLFGASECGPACIKFAVDEPRLVAGLILFGALAKGCWSQDYPHALRASQYRLAPAARRAMGRSGRDRNFCAEPGS